MPRPLTLESDRFRKNYSVLPSGCWKWKLALDRDGYGFFYTKRKGKWLHLRPHRVSFELNFGPIPPELFVLHKCDNPWCVNPEHLFLGSAKDNAADCIAKGRWIKRKDNIRWLKIGRKVLAEKRRAAK